EQKHFALPSPFKLHSVYSVATVVYSVATVRRAVFCCFAFASFTDLSLMRLSTWLYDHMAVDLMRSRAVEDWKWHSGLGLSHQLFDLLVMMGLGVMNVGILCVVWIMISLQVLGAVAGCKVPPAIFVFGDGTLDVGNNNYLNYSVDLGSPDQANHSYYGIDFPNSEPTGRFSNGYNIADFIAMAMGLQISPPAYLSLAGTINMDGFTGVNYASESAKILSIADEFDASADNTIPLLMQLDDFTATRAQMEVKLGSRELKKLLSKSLFLIGIGSWDLFYAWRLQTMGIKYNQADVPYLARSLGASIKALYDAGARKFGVINVPPIGCSPAGRWPWRVRGHVIVVRGRCDGSKNELAVEFNNGVRRLMANLSSELDGLRYSIGDFYGFANATFANPSAAGFVDITSECCAYPCDSPPCQNRTQYWFWDVSNPTEQAAKLAAAAFYDGPAQFTVPISFKKLVQRK
ncbi:GDSL esterase/lipase, partial [Dichanthelium oligosanthes]